MKKIVLYLVILINRSESLLLIITILARSKGYCISHFKIKLKSGSIEAGNDKNDIKKVKAQILHDSNQSKFVVN
jgi:hypothetical protein